MCGIAGIIRKINGADLHVQIEAMTDLIRHRGPDGYGYYFGDHFAFGHRRLAIVDLSENGHQPMQYAAGKYVITYNGEVYNYLEIRSELEVLGCVFQSHSDTEVILAAYRQWGEECVSRFNGMWAFAIYDVERNVIFCSRDRFGVKPFYYTDTETEFSFGSEIKQLLGFLPECRANREVLLNFLVTGFTDRIDDTFFVGICQLPGGHNLIYDLGSKKYCIIRYYQIKLDSNVEAAGPEEAEVIFRQAFSDGIALRLRSDVKVGTCLSGGLDSSSIATLAAKMYGEKTGEQFSAITAISTQTSNDESEFARIVAEHARIRWLRIKPTYEEFSASLDDVVVAQEEPFGSPSIIMQYLVMKAARDNGIPVLLDGQGGDETLLGYPIYHASNIVSAFHFEGWFAALNALRDSGNKSAHGIFTISKYLIGSINAQARYRLYKWRHRYLKSVPPLPQGLIAFAQATSNVQELQNLEITRTNLPVLLRYEDKNSMAHSVETRLPFLDYRTLEIALSLPSKVKIRGGWTKWILRKIMIDEMPASIVWRKNKFGFEAPEDQWLTQHASKMRDSIISSRLLAELCDMNKLDSMLDEMDLRSRWRLYSIALWEVCYNVS